MKTYTRLNFLMALLTFFLFSCGKDQANNSCFDGVLNGSETGIDCGGECDNCPSCFDGIQNGNEQEIDCGGECTTCPTCDDGIQNGNETSIDCGGDCGYCIGDLGPANGIIFYDRGPNVQGWRYLEAAPSDQAESASWGRNNDFVGNTSTAIGSGPENCAQALSEGVLVGSAISISWNLQFGGQGNWFLPSKDELLLMYDRKELIGQFTNGAYWSSSEVTFEDAWLVEFSNGDTYDEFKTREIRVRAIRRF